MLTTDNNLINGYASGMDLHDAPTALNPTGPTGSAAFQWGTPASNSSYPHSSALWLEPLLATNVGSEQYFNIGYLYYLELSFVVDKNTLDGTLSTPDQFKVFEGYECRAEPLGRFTTTPGVPNILPVPEPSSAIMAVLGVPTLVRRKR